MAPRSKRAPAAAPCQAEDGKAGVVVGVTPDLAEATIQWFPSVPAFPNAIQEQVHVTLKNGSTSTIIAASIIILDKNTNEAQSYKAYVDSPIGLWHCRHSRCECNDRRYG